MTPQSLLMPCQSACMIKASYLPAHDTLTMLVATMGVLSMNLLSDAADVCPMCVIERSLRMGCCLLLQNMQRLRMQTSLRYWSLG